MHEMINSEIDWVPEIPVSWHVMPYKYVFKNVELPARENDEIVTCFRDGQVTLRKNRREDGFTVAEQESGYQHISKGDLVVHGMDGFAGSIGISDSDGKATPVLIVMNPLHDECSRYFMYQLRTYADLEVFLATATGIRVRSCSLNWKKLGNLPAIVPPPKEQRLIADYLDKRCDAIDETRKTIEAEIYALRRLRKATIFKAVTKGLVDTVSMRHSGIEWIGDIPSDWEVRKNKHLFDILKRIAGREGYDVLSVTQHGLRIKDVTSGEGQLADDYSGYQLVYPGDFVMNHMDLLTGWVDCSELHGVTSPDYRVFRPKRDVPVDSRFYKYVFQYCYSGKVFYNLGNGVSGKGRWRLQASAFKNFGMPLPPIEEQRCIADYLDERCAAIDSIIDVRTRQLERLEDYRKALIYAYATGKKEVPAS